jgi:hypothetical protein
MYDHIHNGLEKIRKDSRFLRDVWKMTVAGEIAGLALPPPVGSVVPTCFIINATSLLDEALEIYIDSNFTANPKEVATLEKRINYIDRNSKLKDVNKLHAIRKMRNKYAHESGQYGNWEEMDQILMEIENALMQLGI